MTVAPAPPGRISVPRNRATCRRVPAVQKPLPGLPPQEDAPVMPPASPSDPYPPSNLGRSTGGDPPRTDAERAWQTLAPHLTRSPHMRLRQYNRTLRRYTYPRNQPITTTLPTRPAALRLYVDGGVAWSIALDFDPGGHDAATVAQHTADAEALFAQLGARTIVDVADSGGRHLWIPLAEPITLTQAQHLTRSCRRLWPTLDISPMTNAREGCLTAPGSPCKDGSHRRLLTPLPDAIRAITRRADPDFTARALHRLTKLAPPPTTVPTTTLPTSGGTGRPLSPLHTIIAEQGTWPAERTTPDGRPWTRSEACYAVLCAAAARGHHEDQVLDNIRHGRWSGLLTLYTGRYGPRWYRRFHAEWRKAAAAASPSTTTPQARQNTGGQGRSTTESDYVRRWLAIAMTVSDQLIPGKNKHNARAVLWALAWLAWRKQRRYVEAGTRSYARGCAGLLDHTTAASILRQLRDLPADNALLQLISTGRGTHGDLYELVIPPAYAHLATDPETWPEPRPIPGAFGVRDRRNPRRTLLGATAWRLHQALSSGATGTAAHLARTAGISRSEAYQVIPALIRAGLARRTSGTASSAGQWEKGPTTPAEAGKPLGAQHHLDQLDARHRRERQQWRAVLDQYAARRESARTPHPEEPLWWPPDWKTLSPTPGTPADHDQDPTMSAAALLTEILGAQLI